ncbi:MAB_1171c family putative transporter [Streptomyces puniciscabiei]|uniref:MAB_1171c family putative transporter n=1 Tax=Streptomyces puniciscabiei TaxID=164348 RepID=UPI0006EB9203|nr:MAB_1171c family putative transporter [Streptomyces puniciscabiei]
MRAFDCVAVVTLLAGTLWTLPALVRRRFRDPMRLHLCLSLFLMGLGNLLAQPTLIALVDRHTATGVAKYTYNAMVLMGLCLMVAFLRERPINRRTAARSWEVLLCAGCLAGMLTMTALLPPRLRNHSLTGVFLSDWRVRVFYDLGNVFLFFGYAACALLAWRHARTGPALRRWSLAVISVGLVGLALSCVYRVLWVNVPALRAPGTPVTYADDFAFGIADTIVVCAGLSLPFFVGVCQLVRDRLDHRAQFHGLEELWRRLVALYPELVLDQRPFAGRLSLADYSSATYRRYVECRDGLTRLGPYLRLAAEELPEAAVAALPKQPGAAARVVDRALRLYGERPLDSAPPTTSALFIPGPREASDDYESDLVGLIEISRELRALHTSRN